MLFPEKYLSKYNFCSESKATGTEVIRLYRWWDDCGLKPIFREYRGTQSKNAASLWQRL